MRFLKAALRLTRHWVWLAPLALGVVFIAAGIYMVAEGRSAKDEVRQAIVSEHITTSEDASIPNQPVDDAATAKSQANAIEAHVMKITGGKTYAELPRDDPNRPTVLNSVTLRSALNLAVMGFKVSDLVIGMGAFMIVIGATFVLFMAPAVYWAAEVANEHVATRKEAVTGPTVPATQ
ncbi:MAG TPA: hypothetical protein VFT91_06855 [Dehalococcoidia bacterium]|nr:hypothetical protein [Dehalococcoidia bacterium]